MKRGMKSGLALNLDSSVIQDNLPVFIAPGLYMGSIHCSFNEAGMTAKGVSHIINTSGTPATFPARFHYLSISIRDKDYSNLLSCIPACNIFIEAGLESGGSVLVHCTGGRSRSAAILTAFLMSSKKIGFEEAFAIVKQARSLAACNAGFEEQLRAYGECGYDVHRAQQMLLRKHLKQASEMRHLSAAGEKGLGPVRRLAATTISNPLRIKLLRPQEGLPDVTIPPLRGSDMQYICRKCQEPLFVASSIVLHTPEDNLRASGRRRGDLDVNAGDTSSAHSDKQTVAKDKDGGLPAAALRTNSDMVNAAVVALNSEEKRPMRTTTPAETVLVTSPLTSNAANGSVYAFSAQPMQSVLPADLSADVMSQPPMTRRHGGSNGSVGKSFNFREESANSHSSNSRGGSVDDKAATVNVKALGVELSSSSGTLSKSKSSESVSKGDGLVVARASTRVSSSVEESEESGGSAMRAGAVDGVSLLRNDLIVPRTPPQKIRPEETCSWIGRMKELECGVIRNKGAQHLPSIVAARDEEVAAKIYGSQCKWIYASGKDARESQSGGRAPTCRV